MNCKYYRTRSRKKQYYVYCTKYKKQVPLFCKCDEIEYKEKKQISSKTIKNDGIKKKTAKLSYLERNRTSLFTDDLEHCIICEKPNVNLHEIFFGTKHRQLSIKYKLVIPLCVKEHHNQVECKGIHFDKELQNEWHKKGQAKFNEAYPDLVFEDIFHRNYL